MFEAVVVGATDPDIEGVEVLRRPALTVPPVELLEAERYVLGTSANLGYTSGALRHVFHTVYYAGLDRVAGRPYGLWVHGNNDTVGAASAVDELASGLSLTKTAATLEVTGAVDAAVHEKAYEPGGTLAVLLME